MSSKSTWADAKRFAHDVCTEMARDNPRHYLVNMAKKLRIGRIFLDYLRNDRMATAVAPLSPRARPHAPVSMPITWGRAKADLNPARIRSGQCPRSFAGARPGRATAKAGDHWRKRSRN